MAAGFRGVHQHGKPPPIHSLAIEVVAEILAGLDSSSLSSALLAHPLFWSTFQAYQQQILREILRRLIPPQLFPLAFVTYEAASIDYSDWNLIRRLLDRLQADQARVFGASPTPSSTWPLTLTRRMVAAMESAHLMVEYFTADFAQQAIPRFCHIFETKIPETRSLSEELRISRAFYRFQLYSNIFGRKSLECARQTTRTIASEDWLVQTLPGKTREEMRCELESFFWPWPPWANEQLICVFEHLEAVISVFFNEVASHDIEWGWRKVDWIQPSVAIPHRRFLVSSKLHSISSPESPSLSLSKKIRLLTSSQLFNGLWLPYQLRQSDEFGAWKALLDSADVSRKWRDIDRVVTMATSFEGSVAPRTFPNDEGVPARLFLDLFDLDQLRGLEGAAAWPGIDDAATLPVNLWRYSNHATGPQRAVFARRNLLLRDAGYVFWDAYVGEKAEILDRVEACSWTFDGRLLPHELPGLQAAMRRSWEERSKIWLEGGWGYWADGDESRVRYDLDIQLENGYGSP